MHKLAKGQFYQLFILLIISLFIAICINNLIVNLTRTEVGIHFNWLLRSSGFALSEHSLPFNPSDNYLWALTIGFINSLKVIIFGLIFATIIGTSAGIARVSKNKLLSSISGFYILIIRQTPLLLQLLFWYFVVFLRLPDEPTQFTSLLLISNKGINIAGINLTVEFTSLLVGLTLFTGASISEVIRGGLNSIDKGQIEASRSIGLSEKDGMSLIIIPQALPAILPGLTSQYLNLAKNSTLAIAVGYPDIYAISDTSITQTGRSIEGFLLILLSFLMLNIIISKVMDIVNDFALKINHKSRKGKV